MKMRSMALWTSLVPLVLAHAATATSRSGDMSYENFAALAERLTAGEPVERLEDRVPGLVDHLKTARAVSAAHWADSTLVDAGSGQEILPAQVTAALGIAVSDSGGVKHVPAGLMHTYGYLFSRVATPFGLKSKRWIESRVDERLGLPAGTFSPFAHEGEFLSNLTAALFDLIGVKEAVPTAARLSPKARQVGAVTENVLWRTPDGHDETRLVRTHLFELAPLEGAPASDAVLLVYEVIDGAKHRLVTAFPVDEKAAAQLMSLGPASSQSFKPRYNLFVDPGWAVVDDRSEGFSVSAQECRDLLTKQEVGRE